MKNILKKQSASTLLIASFVLAISIFSLSIANVENAYARDAGCYVTSQGTITPSNCPEKDSDGNNIDPAKCYFAPGSSQGIGLYKETACETASSSNSSSSDTECTLQNKDDPGCEGLNTTQDFGDTTDTCGKGDGMEVKLGIDIGCRGTDWPDPEINPIVDMAFALFRFLSAGVGIVVVASIIVSGIQYSASRGNPQATEASMKRVTNSVLALFLYIFIFAISNYLIPGGMFI